MKNLKYIVGLLILAIVSCTTPLTEEEKNSDSVLLKQVHEFTLNDDGSVDYHYYHRRLYNTNMSFHRLYGETFVVYNPDYQTLTVSKSQTTMADGKKVQSPQNAFNEVLPFQAADAPAYNNLREMVITHVGLEIGAVVELDYTIHSVAGFIPVFSSNIILNESSPIKELEVVVKVPKGHQFNHEIINASSDIKLKKKTKGNFDVFQWEAKNVAPISNEPLQVEGMADYIQLMFSEADLSQTFELLRKSFTKEFDFDQSMEKLFANDQKGWDKIEGIRKYVVTNINTYRVMPKHAGYTFRSPKQVWQSNGGTEGEKVILLAALLNNAGLKSQPAFGAYPHFVNKSIGCISAFDKYYVAVEYEGETRFISAIDNNSPSLSSRMVISFNDVIDSIIIEPIKKPDMRMSLNSTLQMDKKGVVSGTGTLHFSHFDKDKGLIIGIPESTIKSKELFQSIDSTVYSVKFIGLKANEIGNYYSFSLPSISQGIELAKIDGLPTKRITRLELPGRINEEYHFVASIPNGYVFVTPVYNQSVENEFGSVLIRHEVLDNGELKVYRHLSLNDCIVSVENYGAFKELMNIWMDGYMKRFFVKPNNKK